MKNGSLSPIQTLQEVDAIVAGGSADSGFAAAACLRHNQKDPTKVRLCPLSPQSYNHLLPHELKGLIRNTIGGKRGAKVLIVGLPAIEDNLSRTVLLINAISQVGTIVGVLDEHGHDSWGEAFKMAGQARQFECLAIRPVDGKRRGNSEPYSAGGLLLKLLGPSADEHTRALCEAAQAADLAQFAKSELAYVMNASLKTVPRRDKKTAAERREYLVRHFACTLTPDKKTLSWVSEYEKEIAPGNTLALEQASDDGKRSVVVCKVGERKFDANYIFGNLFSRGCSPKYVLIEYLEEGVPRVVLRVSPRVNRDAGFLLRSLGVRYSGGVKRVFFASEHLDMVVRALCEDTSPVGIRQ